MTLWITSGKNYWEDRTITNGPKLSHKWIDTYVIDCFSDEIYWPLEGKFLNKNLDYQSSVNLLLRLGFGKTS